MLDEIEERQHAPFLMQVIECKRNMAKPDLQNSLIVVAGLLLVVFILPAGGVEARLVKPFWTEKSSYIEGNYLYVVGIASNAPTVEAGRKRAFENGKSEIMNFSQLSNLDGLVIETQMTYQEKNGDGFNIYRLMYVDYEGVNALKNKSIEATQRNYERFHQKQAHEIAIRKKALNMLSQSNEEIALLDKEYYRIVSKVRNVSDKAMRYVKVGMARDEVEMLLGLPRSISRHYDGFVHDYKYGEYWVIFDNADTVECLSTGRKCVYKNCSDEHTRCSDQGYISYYNRMRVLD